MYCLYINEECLVWYVSVSQRSKSRIVDLCAKEVGYAIMPTILYYGINIQSASSRKRDKLGKIAHPEIWKMRKEKRSQHIKKKTQCRVLKKQICAGGYM